MSQAVLNTPSMALLSKKDIPVDERLIVALDMQSVEDAKALVTSLGDSVKFYKIGLTLIFDAGYWPLFDWLKSQGKKAFADIKIYDIPETVKGSVEKLVGRGAAFATVHAHEKMIKAAIEARGVHSEPKILAVTVLTSLDSGDLKEMGFSNTDVTSLVLDRAKRMLEMGCDGVISSGMEVSSLRSEHGEGFLIVVPGIRPVTNEDGRTDDQKRVVDVEDAFNAGADYIVVGRPIIKAADPKAAADAIQARIKKLFTE